MNIRDYKTVTERRDAVSKICETHLPAIGNNMLENTDAPSKNCENMIGAVQIPLGIAGPLLFTSEDGKKKDEYLVPLATTEGALVASINRGCKAITQSGGATVFVKQAGITRGPVFETRGLAESMKVSTWIENHTQDLAAIAEKTSAHLSLIETFVQPIGKRVYVRFSYDTKDAMGMNMATIATTAVTSYIEEKTHAKCLSVAGNFDTDKKPSWLNVIRGRGRKVWIEVMLPEDVLRDVLKTSAEKMFDVWLSKNMIGSALSGSMSFNAHAANAVAALFAATGQDIAHVGEVSICTVTADIVGSGLLMSVYLPDVVAGTIGGGTGLPTQKEALSLMGVSGGGDGKNGEKFAGIVGGVVLAGEISLLASLAQGSLSQSHVKLARGGTK